MIVLIFIYILIYNIYGLLLLDFRFLFNMYKPSTRDRRQPGPAVRQGADVPEVLGQGLGGGLAHLGDAQRVDEAPQRGGLAQGDGVNYTGGLPVVRTSPDHGTAFDIAGKNLADPDSFREAVFQCIELLNQRKNYASNTANPLRRGRIEKEKEGEEEKKERRKASNSKAILYILDAYRVGGIGTVIVGKVHTGIIKNGMKMDKK